GYYECISEPPECTLTAMGSNYVEADCSSGGTFSVKGTWENILPVTSTYKANLTCEAFGSYDDIDISPPSGGPSPWGVCLYGGGTPPGIYAVEGKIWNIDDPPNPIFIVECGMSIVCTGPSDCLDYV
ncbi:MAG: hypothetical protein KAT35_02685, partial [Candidatus Aenigmarchaeota archaeon]|nr:hypothetical protein [Candidatus Aenigmarchaeota archaeon]